LATGKKERTADGAGGRVAMPSGVVKALMGVERTCIEASQAEMGAWGGLGRCFSAQLGLCPAERGRLQAGCLQQALNPAAPPRRR
jgi:hypothetical protein